MFTVLSHHRTCGSAYGLDLPDEEVYFVRLRDEDGRGLEPHVECSFFNQDSSGSGPQQGASAGMRQ